MCSVGQEIIKKPCACNLKDVCILTGLRDVLLLCKKEHLVKKKLIRVINVVYFKRLSVFIQTIAVLKRFGYKRFDDQRDFQTVKYRQRIRVYKKFQIWKQIGCTVQRMQI